MMYVHQEKHDEVFVTKVKDPDWKAQCTEQLALANREKLCKMDYSETVVVFLFCLFVCFSYPFYVCAFPSRHLGEKLEQAEGETKHKKVTVLMLLTLSSHYISTFFSGMLAVTKQ